MTYTPMEQIIGMQPINETRTVRKHPLGTRVKAYDPDRGVGEFIYLPGVANTAVGSWAKFSADDFGTILLDSDSSGTDKEGEIGVSMSANVASQYGWYQIYGKASGLCLSGFVDNADVYITSTAGSVDDTVVDGFLVHKALGASARDTTTGLADFDIAYPYVDGIAGND